MGIRLLASSETLKCNMLHNFSFTFKVSTDSVIFYLRVKNNLIWSVWAKREKWQNLAGSRFSQVPVRRQSKCVLCASFDGGSSFDLRSMIKCVSAHVQRWFTVWVSRPKYSAFVSKFSGKNAVFFYMYKSNYSSVLSYWNRLKVQGRALHKQIECHGLGPDTPHATLNAPPRLDNCNKRLVI